MHCTGEINAVAQEASGPLSHAFGHPLQIPLPPPPSAHPPPLQIPPPLTAPEMGCGTGRIPSVARSALASTPGMVAERR